MLGCLTCLRKLYTATGHITSTVYTIDIYIYICTVYIYIYMYTHILRDISIFIFSSLGFAANSNWRIPRLLSLLLSRMQPKRLPDYCSSFYDKLGYNHKISWIQWMYNNLCIHICVCMLVCSGTPTPRRPQYETTCLSLGVVLDWCYSVLLHFLPSMSSTDQRSDHTCAWVWFGTNGVDSCALIVINV